MGSKYIDLALIVFMSYFAFTRFTSGQIGFGIFFAVLASLNILTLVMKVKKEKIAKNDVR
jgi:hypothetical protein